MTPQLLENIHSIIIHCSANREGQWVTAAMIDKQHREERRWSMIGYHLVIRLDGSWEPGRPLTRRGAHVAGHNKNTLGIVLIGGLDRNGFAKDTFSGHQYSALYKNLVNFTQICPNLASIKGHRDYSPDLNGDQLITPDEWIKQCPCFDVEEKLLAWKLGDFIRK